MTIAERRITLATLILALAAAAAFSWLALNNSTRISNARAYAWQARSFLEGRLDIPSERVRELDGVDFVTKGNRVYWPLGPLPSLLLVPLVAVAGDAAAQAVFQVAMAACILFLAFRLAGRAGFGALDSGWLSFGLLFSSVLFGAAMLNGPWYLANTISVALALAALNEYLGRRRAWLIGLAVALAFATRLTAGFLAAVFFGWTMLFAAGAGRRAKLTALAKFAAPIAVVLLGLGLFNYARFGSVWDTGYHDSFLGPSPALERRDRAGLFSPSYIADNVYNYFLRLPEMRDGRPVANPIGLSFFLVSPIFLWLFAAGRRTPHLAAVSITAAAGLAIFLSYYATGFWQFGPRYLCDMLPFLFLLLLATFKKRGLGRLPKAVIAGSAAFNIYLLQATLKAFSS